MLVIRQAACHTITLFGKMVENTLYKDRALDTDSFLKLAASEGAVHSYNMPPTPFNRPPKILRYLHHISRQRPPINHRNRLPNLLRLARTKNNPIPLPQRRMMRQPANRDFNGRQIARLHGRIERAHRGRQVLCAEELLRKLAQGVIVSEAGACVIVVDELGGQEARRERSG